MNCVCFTVLVCSCSWY
uniref:Uncharacterized protein n=1 Tax=Anguilla anguilla TaxID=7936 RepID=A0A0E9SEF8_ANGAN